MEKDKEIKENEFEKEVSDLKEWQENQFNPGYFIGTGRVPKPLASLSKFPRVLIVIGAICLIIGTFTIFSQSFTFENIIGSVFPIVFGGVFVCGGVVRLRARMKNKLK